jgi:hypothetical protein
MQELESRLTSRKTAFAVSFDSLNHHIHCYAHIINLCSSHVVAFITSTSKAYLSKLNVPIDTSSPYDDDDNDNDDKLLDEVIDSNYDHHYNNQDDPKLACWFAGIKRDPIKRARKVICILHSLDQWREGFCVFIQDGNQCGWFMAKDNDGRRAPVQVPELQPLRDVKTRWDSVYMMLEWLRQLQPVCSSCRPIV